MYITAAELGIKEETLKRLTDDEGSGSVNSARAEAAIVAAQARVDSALSRSFDTPLPDPPELVRSITRDIAVYNLYKRIGSPAPEVRKAYEDAVEVLDKVAGGMLCIGLDAPGPEFSCQDREFSREFMGGF